MKIEQRMSGMLRVRNLDLRNSSRIVRNRLLLKPDAHHVSLHLQYVRIIPLLFLEIHSSRPDL